VLFLLDFYGFVNGFHSISRLHSTAIRFHSLAASAVHQFCFFVTLFLARAVSFAWRLPVSFYLYLYLAICYAPTCFLNAFDHTDTVDKFLLPPRVDLWLLFCFFYLLRPAFVFIFIYLVLFALAYSLIKHFFYRILSRFVVSILRWSLLGY